MPLIVRCFFMLDMLLVPGFAGALPPHTMPQGATILSAKIYQLYMISLWTCFFIALFVFSWLIFNLIKYRKNLGLTPQQFNQNFWLEFTWIIIPILILIGLGIPATKILFDVHDTKASSYTISITGYQWRWKYEYYDYGLKFFSQFATPLNQIFGNEPKNPWFLLEVTKPLVVPINTKIKLLFTSQDVIHSWWVPELGIKQDALPGYINENWFYITKPGIYRGQCSELCGVYHAFMPIVVQAVSVADFQRWIVQQKILTSQNNSAADHFTFAESQDLYQRNCAMCHLNNGHGYPGYIPSLNESVVSTAPKDLTIAYILQGVSNSPMHGYADILSNNELAAIITYIRSAWGNAAIVQRKGYDITIDSQDITKIKRHLHLENHHD
jgi:cytochrome c oxidase subunit 2